jgi:AcrR family transcriptional regulator
MMSERPQRADARRNRSLIITAARHVIADDGPNASLDKISRRAGVGAGTLYRHFPSREDLLIAVYTDRIDFLCDRAQAAGETLPPGQALTTWLQAMLDHAMSDRGLAGALDALGTKPEIECTARINAAATELLLRAQEAGHVHPGATTDDILRLVIGLALATDDQSQANRLLDFALDGLRRR